MKNRVCVWWRRRESNLRQIAFILLIKLIIFLNKGRFVTNL